MSISFLCRRTPTPSKNKPASGASTPFFHKVCIVVFLDSHVNHEFIELFLKTLAGNSVAAGTSGSLAYGDVVNILKECLIDNFTPDVLVIHLSELADLLTDTAIRRLWNGEDQQWRLLAKSLTYWA